MADIDDFNAHLDECEQCRKAWRHSNDGPEMCAKGARIYDDLDRAADRFEEDDR